MNRTESLQENPNPIDVGLKTIGIETPSDKLSSLEKLVSLVIAYNSHTNLIADASPEIIRSRHILDSLSALQFWPDVLDSASDKKTLSLVDLGSGAGFPGLVLAIWIENLNVTLVDSNRKKIRFLEEAAAALELGKRVKTVHARLEELGRDPAFRGRFDLVSARALGHLALNAELGLPLLKRGGKSLFYKTEKQAKEEAPVLNSMLESLGGGEIEYLVPVIQEGNSKHILIRIEKLNRGSDSFPRSWKNIKRDLERYKTGAKSG
ncbi:MAG TPA: 16S rRNA (guanine(527)-N(7))-methyltransferase RsmG [Candidatus Melainabacteria bacterium]|mgnify:CR=1 FL=1|nr:16S rRNA (guanine(527)-N(7))-methyltransferase RsmG [Candidatus Melainabacteria bacterium]